MNGTLRSHWTEEKNKMKVLLEKSVTANKGNLGMLKRFLKKDATSPKKYKCCASFVWYSVEQVKWSIQLKLAGRIGQLIGPLC